MKLLHLIRRARPCRDLPHVYAATAESYATLLGHRRSCAPGRRRSWWFFSSVGATAPEMPLGPLLCRDAGRRHDALGRSLKQRENRPAQAGKGRGSRGFGANDPPPGGARLADGSPEGRLTPAGRSKDHRTRPTGRGGETPSVPGSHSGKVPLPVGPDFIAHSCGQLGNPVDGALPPGPLWQALSRTVGEHHARTREMAIRRHRELVGHGATISTVPRPQHRDIEARGGCRWPGCLRMISSRGGSRSGPRGWCKGVSRSVRG